METNKVIEQLDQSILKYLHLHEDKVKFDSTGKKFCCLNPAHNDTHPSVCIDDSYPTLCHCFGCSNIGQNGWYSIFHLANWLEGLPRIGGEFWTVTIPNLAKQLGIEYTLDDMSEVQREEYSILAIHEDAANYIRRTCGYINDTGEFKEAKVISKTIDKFITDRKWSKETCYKLRIGGVSSYSIIVDYLVKLGWDKDDIEGYGIKPGIFNPTNVIFAINNIRGKCIAFTSRNMNWSSGGPDKWRNSSTSITYKKEATLYMLDYAMSLGEKGPLWITEGYGDAVTLWEQGIKKVCSTGGKFTKEHVRTLEEEGITDVILCPDMDINLSGQNNTTQVVADYFQGSDINVSIVKIPFAIEGGLIKSQDPDDFIQENGIVKFTSLPRVEPFEWILEQYTLKSKTDGSYNPETLAYTLVRDVIAKEDKRVKMFRMIQMLEKSLGIPATWIEAEVQRILDKEDIRKTRKLDKIKEDLRYKLSSSKYSPKDIEEFLGTLRHSAEEAKNSIETMSVSIKDDYSSRIHQIKQKVLDAKSQPLNLGRFLQLSNNLEGIPRDGLVNIIAGIPNIGKSSFVRNLAWEISTHNKDVVVLYVSIDDSTKILMMPLLSQISYLHDKKNYLTISEISNPHKLSVEKYKIWENTWNLFEANKNRFIIVDSTQGSNLSTLERHIENVKNINPDKYVVAVLDNYHCLSDPGDSNEKWVRCAKRIKQIATKFSIPIFITAELNKIGAQSKATHVPPNIKDAYDLAYDANLIGFMYQDLYYNTESGYFFDKGVKTKFPVNELMILHKNKINGWKGSIFYKFDTTTSVMTEMFLEEAEDLKSRNKRKAGTDIPQHNLI